MSDLIKRSEAYRRERARAELRGGSGIKALYVWAAVGLLGLGGGMFYGVLMSIK